MRPVSDTWKRTVTSSHQTAARARLVTPGQTGTNPGPLDSEGKPKFLLALESGDVEFDPTAEVRANADCVVTAAWPASASAELNTYGAMELFLEKGIVYGDGATEWVSLGYYRLDELDQPDAPNGPIAIQAPDRMQQIIDERLPFPRQYDAAATIRAVVEDLVQEVYPSAVVVIEGFDPDVAIGVSQIVEQDRYGFLIEIAKARGCTMYFDYDGSFVMRPVPELGGEPVAYLTDGRDGVLVKVSRKLSRRGAYNGFVATGEQSGDLPPVRQLVVDDDPSSPTVWGGTFGRVPKFFSSSFITTDEQAYTAAAAMRTRETGVPYTVRFGKVPNPALEPLDPVGIRYSERGMEFHVLDKLSIPLAADGVMTGSTRAKTRTV
ncbi:MAG: DUF5047 domain-containing protein [Dermatophilaceae bacterium]|nr:DUF5047 domain-containing protein [Dermatophilaceae bacterium]